MYLAKIDKVALVRVRPLEGDSEEEYSIEQEKKLLQSQSLLQPTTKRKVFLVKESSL